MSVFWKRQKNATSWVLRSWVISAFRPWATLAKAFPSLVKMRAWNNLYSLVAKHIKNPQLREVMSFHPLLIGGNPFHGNSSLFPH
jgi:hypothetical protein